MPSGSLLNPIDWVRPKLQKKAPKMAFFALVVLSLLYFFDEFDTIGKERGDASDTTDVKRAVGMLLIHIELTPPPTIVMAATNHQELLDHAAW